MTGLVRPAPLDPRRAVAMFALAALAFVAVFVPGPATAPNRASSAAPGLPLSFVANHGQTDPQVHYYAHAPGFSAYFTREGLTIALSKGERGHALELRFASANPRPAIEPLDRRRGRVNYLTASERHTDIPTFGGVAYRDLWPGIDLLFRTGSGRLKYEFHVAAGANPADIHLAYAGAQSLSVISTGALAVQTPIGALEDAAPRSYQPGGTTVPSRYVPRGKRSYGFALARYDRARPLVIDPSLAYSTYLGGGFSGETGRAIAIDSSGSAYVGGPTDSPDFPTTPGAFDRTRSSMDAFVTKLSPDGSTLMYSTYLGGSNIEDVGGIALDPDGSAYVAGNTHSADFPTTAGAYRRTRTGFWLDAFAAKLTPDGTGLVYSTYLGGTEVDFASGVARDGDGNAYLVGTTESTDFPVTPGALNIGGPRGAQDAFAAKLSADGSSLLYSTALGSAQGDGALDVAVDADGRATLTGYANDGFPTTPGAFDPTNNGFSDVFVTRVNAAGTGLVYSTFLGGSGGDAGEAIELDAASNAYVAGSLLRSPDYPTTAGAYDTTYNGGNFDAAVTKLNAAGSGLVYSTFLGGANSDESTGIAVDGSGRVVVTGYSASTDYPLTPGAFDTSTNGDAILTKLNAAGSALAYSTFLGGVSYEQGDAIAIDARGSAYVSGQTASNDFPTTPGAYDRTLGGSQDAFVSKISATAATLTLSPETATNTLDEGSHCVTATATDAAGDPTPGIAVKFTVTGATTASGSETTGAGGEATFCYQGPELPGTDQITATVEPSGPSDIATKTWIAPPSSDDCKVNAEGSIRAANGDRADFNLEAKINNAGSVKGRARYTDRGPADHLELNVKTLDGLVCEGRDATIFAHQDSVALRIEVSDRSRNGRQDRFRIVTVQGYDSGQQPLVRGNVKVR